MKTTFKTIGEFNEAVDWLEKNAIRFEAYCDLSNPSGCWVKNICLRGELASKEMSEAELLSPEFRKPLAGMSHE